MLPLSLTTSPGRRCTLFGTPLMRVSRASWPAGLGVGVGEAVGVGVHAGQLVGVAVGLGEVVGLGVGVLQSGRPPGPAGPMFAPESVQCASTRQGPAGNGVNNCATVKVTDSPGSTQAVPQSISTFCDPN